MKLYELLTFYKSSLKFNNFYDIIFETIQKKDYNPYSSFLSGFIPNKDINKKDNKFSNYLPNQISNLRIDIPIWFGNINSETRIMVFGSEPHDTDEKFNVEENIVNNNKYIFASCFGVDRWNNDSSIKRKPQNKYYDIFRDILDNKKNIFLLFSDVIKYFHLSTNKILQESDSFKNIVTHYEIKEDKIVKTVNGALSRNIFYKFAKSDKNLSYLRQEISLINPTYIICFGLKIKHIVEKIKEVKNSKIKLITIPHPASKRISDENKIKINKIC